MGTVADRSRVRMHTSRHPFVALTNYHSETNQGHGLLNTLCSASFPDLIQTLSKHTHTHTPHPEHLQRIEEASVMLPIARNKHRKRNVIVRFWNRRAYRVRKTECHQGG